MVSVYKTVAIRRRNRRRYNKTIVTCIMGLTAEKRRDHMLLGPVFQQSKTPRINNSQGNSPERERDPLMVAGKNKNSPEVEKSGSSSSLLLLAENHAGTTPDCSRC